MRWAEGNDHGRKLVFMGGGWCVLAEIGAYGRKLMLIGGSWCS